MIVSACLFILGYAATWAPGIWILTGETFPTRTRSYQASLAAMSNWAWNFLLAFFTPFITNAIHFRYGFIFAACNLAGAVIVYFFLYESSDLSLESVDMVSSRAPNMRKQITDVSTTYRCIVTQIASLGHLARGLLRASHPARTSSCRIVPPRRTSRPLASRRAVLRKSKLPTTFHGSLLVASH